MLKMWGPYKRPDGRSHVIWHDSETGKRRTQSYPRYLMEQHLGRELLPEEYVDHINNDPTDNRIENLQILTPLENNIKALIDNEREKEIAQYKCPYCGIMFFKDVRVVRHNQGMYRKAGPFCSRRCAGKWSNGGH